MAHRIFMDLSAIEARVLALHVKPEVDLYIKKAAELYGITTGEVTKEQRHVAKALYYMETYQASPRRLDVYRRQNGCPREG